MKITKETIKSIILGEGKDFQRFEMIENFVNYASEHEDVKFLVAILKNDKSSIIRHEAAAQLLKIEQKKPWLIDKLRSYVIEELLTVVLSDKSLVARHESAEALSYIGDKNVLETFENLINSNITKDEIIETVITARDTIKYRMDNNIKASELSASILKEIAT